MRCLDGSFEDVDASDVIETEAGVELESSKNFCMMSSMRPGGRLGDALRGRSRLAYLHSVKQF